MIFWFNPFRTELLFLSFSAQFHLEMKLWVPKIKDFEFWVPKIRDFRVIAIRNFRKCCRFATLGLSGLNDRFLNGLLCCYYETLRLGEYTNILHFPVYINLSVKKIKNHAKKYKKINCCKFAISGLRGNIFSGK